MRILVASLGLWALGGLAAMAQPTVVAVSQIDSVTVYLEGALVHRSFTAQVPAGESNVTFEGLTAMLEGSTLVVGMDGGLQPLSVNLESKRWDPYGEEAYYTALTDSLAALNWEIEALDNEVAALREELSVLKENRQLQGGASGLSLEQLEKISTYMRTRTLAIQQAISVHTRDQAAWKRQVALVTEALNRYRRGIPQTRKDVSMVVRTAQSQRVSGTLSYFARQANWNAEYDIAVADLDSDLQITYKANIYNGTYEDWNKVAVKVSTATPSLDVTLPTLSVWRLNTQQSAYLRSEAVNYTQNIAFDDSSEPTLEIASASGPEVVEAGEFAVEFRIFNPVTLAGNYAQRVYELQELAAPSSYQHYAIPKLGKQVYLIARLADWNQLNLLSGKASIYFNGRYTGQSNINIRNVRDTLEFSLGEDPQVLVSRKLEEDYRERILVGTKVRERKGYSLFVKNSRSSDITIRILDQHPISAQDEVEVTLTKHGGAEVNENTGELTWNLELAPGAVRQLGFVFEVVYPKNAQVKLRSTRQQYRAPRFSY